MTSDFQQKLLLLRASRFATLLVIALGPALTAGLVFTNRIFGALVVVMTWMPCFLLAIVFQTSLVCPRCGRPFFRAGSRGSALRGRQANLFAGACLHCGGGTRNGEAGQKERPLSG